MRSCGIYKLVYTLHPNVFPHADGMRMSPQDMMHNFFSSGIVNSEGAALLYVLMKKRYFTFAELTDAFDNYLWPAGDKPPAIHPSVCIGRTGGMPKVDAHLRFSGSHTLHFAQVKTGSRRLMAIAAC